MKSKEKDTSFCKQTGKNESNTSAVAMIRSLTIPMVTSAIKESEEYRNRKRRNEEAKDYLHSQWYNAQVLTSNFNRRTELKDVTEAEFIYAKTVLSEHEHYHKKRQAATVTKYAQSKDIMKRSNASMKITGVEYAPLLLGQVQIGTAHNDQRDLLIEELLLRGFTVDSKELITNMKKRLIEHEHPNTTDPKIAKYFYPKFLTAVDWHKDRLDNALRMIADIRRNRLEE